MSLSPAATIVMTRAAERPDRRLQFHRKLPTAARHKMIDALLRDGLITESAGDYRMSDGAILKVDAETGLLLTTLALTDDGLRAIGHEPATVADTAPPAGFDVAVAKEAAAVADALDAATQAPTGRNTLRQAAAAVLAAWDDEANRDTDIIAALEVPMEALRPLLTGKAPRATASAPREPREETKQQAVIAMLTRPDGATVAQIMEQTGWAPHTVRGFLAGLKKKGFTIETLERVRIVGPNKEGAKGSFSIYRIAPVV